MIQAIGLTSLPRRSPRQLTVDDLTFEARPGRVTVLLGPEGAGKTSALRLMLQLQAGRGVALFRGRPVHRIQHLAREVGVLLGDVPGHPARSARGHLRMLAAAAGVPADRADDVLDVVGLSGLADQRMGSFSLGMDRRLGVACALLGDPHTLVLDEPGQGLSPRESNWLHSLLRGYAKQGGAVLVTSHEIEEAAKIADRVVSMHSGRLVADQDAADFVRTRLRPRVAVRTPHAERLTAVLTQEARRAGRTGRDGGPLKVVREGGGRVSVYGSTCAEVGEHAYRNGILVHQLTDETGDTGDAGSPSPLKRADGRRASHQPASAAAAASPAAAPAPAVSVASEASVLEASVSEPSAPATSESLTASVPASLSVSAPARVRALVSAFTSAAVPGSAPVTSDDAPTLRISCGPLVEASATPAGAAKQLPSAVRSPLAPPGWAPLRPAVRAPAHLPPRLYAVPRPGPVAPLRYELRRLTGLGITWAIVAATVAAALCISLVLARTGIGVSPASGSTLAPALRLLTGWPSGGVIFLPPVAVAVGLLGALAFGQEFRYPALAPARSPVPHRLSLLVAKLAVSAALSVVLSVAVAAVNAVVLMLFFGADALTVLPAQGGSVPAGGDTPWLVQGAAVLALSIGCGWAGVLAAGVFRSTLVGAGVVLAVPLLIVPMVQKMLGGPAGRSVSGLPARLEAALLVPWPPGAERWLSVGFRLASQPIGRALSLSLMALLCAYLITAVRSRAR